MLATVARGIGGLLVLLGALTGKPPADMTPDEATVGFAQTPTAIPEFTYRDETLCRIYRVTAYCDIGLTASGVPSGVGQCAAPADIPFGSIIYIPELDREFVVTDRTAERFRHNTVDIFIPSREDCLEFGRNYLECEVILPEKAPRYGSAAMHSLVANFN